MTRTPQGRILSVAKTFLRLLASPQKLKRTLHYALLVNDEFYWDQYVKDWVASKQGKNFERLGNEWKNEEIFLSLLEKHGAGAKSALEIGCGGGRITAQGIKHFDLIHAADVSAGMLEMCETSVPGEKLRFHKLDGFTLGEFQDHSVDLVYSHDVFVHFSSLQVYPYFKEIKRVLKPGGKGLISFYNFRRHFSLFREMSLVFNTHRIFPPHMRVHFVTEEMVLTMLEDLQMTGLEVEKENFLIVAFQA